MKRPPKAKLPLSLLFAVLAMVCVAALSPGLANAAPVTLTDLNSSVTIDPASQAGASSWTVDGVNQLYQQWFWYRVGNNPEQSINTISAPVVNTAGRILDLTYANALFSVGITYTLTGGTQGSGTADLAETIRIINLSGTSLDFHFFQYSDFDVNDTSRGQTVTVSDAHNTVRQTGNGTTLSETVVGPTPQHWEASTYANTINKLNDGVATTLNDVLTAGPGDATWAFEWDETLAAGGTLIISKDKRIAPVPLPPSALLLGSGLVGLGLLRFRRKNRA